MRELRWTTGRPLAGPLLFLLLASSWALAQAPTFRPVSADAKPTTVSVSTDLTTSPLLAHLSSEIRLHQYSARELIPESAPGIEAEIAAGGMRLAKYLTERDAPAIYVAHWLFLAAKSGHSDMVPYFRAPIGDLKSVRDYAGRTPLHLARSVKEIEYFLAQGVPLDLADRHGETPLTFVLFGSLYDPADEGWGVVGPDSTSATLAMALCLLDHGANPDPVTANGDSLLADSLRLGKHYRLLLEKGANPKGRRSLIFEARDSDCLKALKEYGADLRVLDEYGRTPLFSSSTPDKVDALLEAGCRVDDRSLSGQTPLHGAVEWDWRSTGGEARAVLVRLVERGADMNAKDLLGRTPLHLALDEELLRRGADINARDVHGQTPVHYYACRFEAFGRGGGQRLGPRLKGLPEVKPDVNAQDEAGRTALHWLSWRGADAKELIEDIISLGAKPNVRDKFGRTPLEYARMTRDREIEALLLQKGGEVATTVTAAVSEGEEFLNPFARAREIVRSHRGDFPLPEGRDEDSLHLFADFLDLNNDGCFDIAISADEFHERSGVTWILMMGTPNGKFRIPDTGPSGKKGEDYLSVYGWDVGAGSSSEVGHGSFSASGGRKNDTFTERYCCDGYAVRAFDPAPPDSPAPKR